MPTDIAVRCEADRNIGDRPAGAQAKEHIVFLAVIRPEPQGDLAAGMAQPSSPILGFRPLPGAPRVLAPQEVLFAQRLAQELTAPRVDDPRHQVVPESPLHVASKPGKADLGRIGDRGIRVGFLPLGFGRRLARRYDLLGDRMPSNRRITATKLLFELAASGWIGNQTPDLFE